MLPRSKGAGFGAIVITRSKGFDRRCDRVPRSVFMFSKMDVMGTYR